MKSTALSLVTRWGMTVAPAGNRTGWRNDFLALLRYDAASPRARARVARSNPSETRGARGGDTGWDGPRSPAVLAPTCFRPHAAPDGSHNPSRKKPAHGPWH